MTDVFCCSAVKTEQLYKVRGFVVSLVLLAAVILINSDIIYICSTIKLDTRMSNDPLNLFSVLFALSL